MTHKLGLLAGGLMLAMLGMSAPAFANDEVDKRAADPNQWAAPGRDNHLTRHSPLKDINTENVGKLQMVWSQSTGALRGHEGQPLFIEDVGGKPMLFFVSGCPNMAQCNIAQGIDLSDPDNPKQIWNYVKTTDRDESAVPRACCDTVNRGPAFADGKLYYGTLDGFLIALDAATGKEVWVVKHAWPEKGETSTSAPLIADNVVILGFGGDEFAARGRVTAYDLKDGKKVWECHSTGSDKDVCLTPETNKANPHYGTAGKDLGIHTHVGEDYKIGGGAAWAWFSYDPELKLVYYSTGNPGLWSPAYRCSKKTHEECNTGEFDNKWSMTIFARKVDTGEAVWAYQMTPFDQWDYDGVNENILVDMDVDGKKRKALVHFDRNGFAYTWDRATGELLVAEKYDPKVNWATHVVMDPKDPQYGRPQVVSKYSTFQNGQDVNTKGICPAALGTKDQQPAAFSPVTGLFYVPTNHVCMDYEPFKVSYTAGQPYVGATLSMFPAPDSHGGMGNFIAWDGGKGKIVWSKPEQFSVWSGALTTDGGVAFYGTLEGYLKAVDQKDGKELFKFRTPSGIIGNVFTYEHKGKQHVGVFSGVGGWAGIGLAAGLTNPNDGLGAVGGYAGLKQYTELGGSLTVFTLP